MSILNANQEGIKEYADKLGVGQLYGLFACMVAGRSWTSITKGIDKAEKSAAEVNNQRKNYIWDATLMLPKCVKLLTKFIFILE